jgi:hypothetical protein
VYGFYYIFQVGVDSILHLPVTTACIKGDQSLCWYNAVSSAGSS